jgi:hypothetical protein
MKMGIFLTALTVNIVVLFCVFNPWFEDWTGQGIVFLIVETVALVLIGVPLFLHHLRKGLTPREALSASLDTVMNFMSGWV